MYIYIYSSPDVYMQSLSVSVFLSFFLFAGHSLFFTPSFHPHIKAIYHQDQTQCVSQRQADLLVGFFCVCEFYDWGQGPGTQRYISDKVSLCLLVFLALSLPFRAAWPTWIARPHVNATFDLNSWVPGDVTTLTSCCSDSVRCDIVKKKDCSIDLLRDIGFSQIYGTYAWSARSTETQNTFQGIINHLPKISHQPCVRNVLSVWLHRWKWDLLFLVVSCPPRLPCHLSYLVCLWVCTRGCGCRFWLWVLQPHTLNSSTFSVKPWLFHHSSPDCCS